MNGEIYVGPIFLFLSVASVALFSFLAVASWSDNRRREREAYYNNETVKKIADGTTPGAAAALEFMYAQERTARSKRREGLRVGGLSTAAAGLAFTIFLLSASPHDRTFTLGLIPTFVGLALLAYTYLLAPRED